MTLRRSVLGLTSASLLLLLALGCSDDLVMPANAGGTAGQGGETGSGGSGDFGAAGESSATGGASGGSHAAGGGAGANGNLLVDDFEDGDATPLIPGGWYSYTDVDNGGGSTLTFSDEAGSTIGMNGEGFDSSRSLEIDYSFDQADLPYEPYVGVGAWLGSSSAPLDLSAYAGISYTYRGGAHTVRVETYDVGDYDFYGAALPASPDWTTVQLAFEELQQEGWGTPVDFDPANVGALSFHMRGATGESATLQVDNLTVLLSLEDLGPDMQVLDPDPPDDATIDSIEISNPLQQRALQYLDRGYNITNWLEEARFEDFDYDEGYVAALAAAGFRSLRLPIDLDLYVEARSGSGDAMELTLHDDLFTILDAFDEWTSNSGLGLTIDYHQYDGSFDVTDSDGVAEAVELWARVAEHFAENPREDLFFELLNEPELSSAATPPTQAEWTEIAERMISAIREQDPTHTIIFGDVDWYGIDALTAREPLSDGNVVYAFHFYEPFIFTHQGASWTALGAAHDVPYPYSPERWSEYYSDLGFSRFADDWIESLIQDYYRSGNRAAVRNRIVEAKGWAVEHDVPVICNEFGVYERTSRLEDRERYYTDLIGIFEELEIPWQPWFMIMDDDGNVIPEYRGAFGLDE